ncbi:hypothetical protein ZIOFF_028378 [Zingiber officinale]|uniref:Uncharacterized protein n=1 Tax=Zingiber officinale TaxID=94328 RepID=A0A8J5GRZ0_ZINOF|nr:hypothetical protein ZIOFF_028378 [Zingiber officinale]
MGPLRPAKRVRLREVADGGKKTTSGHQRRRGKGGAVVTPPPRTTAPPPGGGKGGAIGRAPTKASSSLSVASKRSATSSSSLSTVSKEELKATMLFKKISLKLDALSHFHFAPKPVIEDMSIQVNVPALAMEEVAPLVASDAAMLAPEEIFHGK